MNYTIQKLPKHTVQLNIVVPWDDIVKEKEKAFTKLQKELEVEGFRKGKAPKSIAEKHITKSALYEQVIRSVFPDLYSEVIEKEGLKPVTQPKIDLKKAEEDADWEIEVILAEMPKADVSQYKKIIEDVKKDSKVAEIWTPGKEEKQDEKEKENTRLKKMDSIVQALASKISCEIPDLIVEEELSQRLSRLLDDIRNIGLTVDGYLQSKGLTMDQLKEHYRKEIQDTYKVEFILQAIADKEKITVDEKDLATFIGEIKDQKTKEQVQHNAYLYTTLLRKQKTLDYLSSL